MEKINFCCLCGAKSDLSKPDGEDRVRDVCKACGYIHYQNPKVVCCTISINDNQEILLAKRAIEPRAHFWTLPGGFLELNENTDVGAKRETEEETFCKVDIIRPFSIFSTFIGNQIHIFYIAKIKSFSDKPTSESEEVRMFAIDDLPWAELSFKTVINTLELYVKNPNFQGVHHGKINSAGKLIQDI